MKIVSKKEFRQFLLANKKPDWSYFQEWTLDESSWGQKIYSFRLDGREIAQWHERIYKGRWETRYYIEDTPAEQRTTDQFTGECYP